MASSADGTGNGSANGNGRSYYSYRSSDGTPTMNRRSASQGSSFANGAEGYGGSSPASYASQSAYSSTSPYPDVYSRDAVAGSKQGVGLRRRQAAGSSASFAGSARSSSFSASSSSSSRNIVKRMDFMFPKVDKEFTERSGGSSVTTVAAYALIFILVAAETVSWFSQNGAQVEHISVDTSIGRRMRVNLNITFPALACEDLHLDAIDIAGDSQLDIVDTLVKRRLHLNGRPYTSHEIKVDTNYHREQQTKKEALLKEKLSDDYCGPCYGAQTRDDQCCQTCDEVIEAYKNKRWKIDLLKFTAEQCVREGRDKEEPKKMTKGEGCNLSGYMTVNRVGGNFHIAMGEGIERDGHHIHSFLPEDAPNFNASHVIHKLTFGPEEGNEPLNGVTKIVTEDTGTTGLFQYFIKIVPTAYVGRDAFPDLKEDPDLLPSLFEEGYEIEHDQPTIETNRYFITERYRPLMTELLDDSHFDSDNRRHAAAKAGYTGGHHNHEHHRVQNAVLPGVFFIYEIYPFCVEISREYVPLTHLLVRIMATVGGVFTVFRWLDSFLRT